MATENHRESVESPARLMVQEVWSRGDLELIDDLVTEDYVHYDVAQPEPIRGPEALKEAVTMYREGTPDLTKTIEETVVEDETVVVPYTAIGTHEGERGVLEGSRFIPIFVTIHGLGDSVASRLR